MKKFFENLRWRLFGELKILYWIKFIFIAFYLLIIYVIAHFIIKYW